MIPFTPQMLGGLGVALLLSLGFNGCQYKRNAVVKLERDTARNDLTQAQAAIKGKSAVIDDQAAALKQWRTVAAQGAVRAMQAGDRAEQRGSELRDVRAALRERERADDALPDCDQLLEMDLASVCPAVAAGMRERARYRLPGSASGDPGPIHPGD